MRHLNLTHHSNNNNNNSTCSLSTNLNHYHHNNHQQIQHSYNYHNHHNFNNLNTNSFILQYSTNNFSDDQEQYNEINEMWRRIEYTIKDNLLQFENARKFCAYCGLKEQDNNEDDGGGGGKKKLTLGRCYGCQMVYYCNQEHQHLDWLENHMPKCAELEWVALGELIQSIPVNIPLTGLNQPWPDQSFINTWTDWFDIRPELVKTCHQIAKTFENNFFSLNANVQKLNGLNKFNRREPPYNDLVDGLLSSITDSMTYALTIGDGLTKIGLNPSMKPICIHIIHPPTDLFDDLANLISSLNNINEISMIDQTELDNTLKNKFYELCNMFSYNKGFELVFISPNTILENVSINNTNVANIDWSKLLRPPFMKTELQNSLPLNEKHLYISSWQGSYSNYIKYVCQIEGYSFPDLVVSFHPNFTQSPQKLITTDWNDDLKIILTCDLPCLFTFYDKDEKQKAFNALNSFQTNIVSIRSNQFSSLMLKQVPTKPNCIYATNSFYMIIKGFIQQQHCFKSALDQQLGINCDSIKRSKSIHDFMSTPQQNYQQFIRDGNAATSTQYDACIQTLGLDEPENASLRHINGKLKITKRLNLNSSNNIVNSNNIYKSNDNINKLTPFNTVDIFIDEDNFNLNSSNNQRYSSNYHSKSYYATPNNVNNNKNNNFRSINNNSMPPPLIQSIQQQQIPLLDFSLSNNYRNNNNNNLLMQNSNILFQPHQATTESIPYHNYYHNFSSSNNSNNNSNNNHLVGYRPNNFINRSTPLSPPNHFNNNINTHNQQIGHSSSENHYLSPKSLTKLTTAFYQPKVLIPPNRINSNINSNPIISNNNCFSNGSNTYNGVTLNKNQENEMKISEEKYILLNINNDKSKRENAHLIKEVENKTIHSNLIQSNSYLENNADLVNEQSNQLPTRPRKLSVSSSSMPNSLSAANGDIKIDQSSLNNIDQNETEITQPPNAKPRVNPTTILSKSSDETNNHIYDKLDKFNNNITNNKHSSNESDNDLSQSIPNAKPRVKSNVLLLNTTSESFSPNYSDTNLSNRDDQAQNELVDLKTEDIYHELLNNNTSKNKPKPRKKSNKPLSKQTRRNPLPRPRNYNLNTKIDSNLSDNETDSYDVDSYENDEFFKYSYANENISEDKDNSDLAIESTSLTIQADTECVNKLTEIKERSDLVSSSSSKTSINNNKPVIASRAVMENDEISSSGSILSSSSSSNTRSSTSETSSSSTSSRSSGIVSSESSTIQSVIINDFSKISSEKAKISSSSSSSSTSSPINSKTNSLSSSSSSSTKSNEINNNNNNSPKNIPCQARKSCSSILSSIHSSSIANLEQSNNGFVNQMKNMFESTSGSGSNNNSNNSSNNTSSTENSPLKQSNYKKYELPERDINNKTSLFIIQDKQVNNDTKIIVKQDENEYMNVSNKYMSYIKSSTGESCDASSDKLSSLISPSLPPPPPPPPLPASLPYTRNTSTNEFELSNLESSPFKQVKSTNKNSQSPNSSFNQITTTDNVVSKLISTSNKQNSPISSENSSNNCTSNLNTTHHLASKLSENSTQNDSNKYSITNNNRLMSNASSSNTNYTLQSIKLTPNYSSEFRIMNANKINNNTNSERSTTPSCKSMTSLNQIAQPQSNQQNRIMIKHIPDAVDVVKLDFEGQRRVVVPGYMTSADILRNMLLNSNTSTASPTTAVAGTTDLKSAAPLIVQRQTTQMTLKEKLLLQQRNQSSGNDNNLSNENRLLNKMQDYNRLNDMNDEELAKKFERRGRTRSMSGIITLDALNVQTTQIIDIDLDDGESVPVVAPTKPQNNLAYPSKTQPSSTSNFNEKPKLAESSPVKQIQQQSNQSTPIQSVKSLSKAQVQYQSTSFAPAPVPPPPPKSLPVVTNNNNNNNNNNNKSLDIVSYSLPNKETHVINSRPTPAVEKSEPLNNHYAVSQIVLDNKSANKFSNIDGEIRWKHNTPASTNKQSVSGAFDPDDFDSFDESEDNNNGESANKNPKSKNSTRIDINKISQNNVKTAVSNIQIESIEKIRENALNQQKLEELEKQKQNMNLVQFDPDDFDSFDEGENDQEENSKKKTEPSTSSPSKQIPQLPVINLELTSYDKDKDEEKDEEILSKEKRLSEFQANKIKLEALFKNRNSNLMNNNNKNTNDKPAPLRKFEIEKNEKIDIPVVIIPENGVPPPPPPLPMSLLPNLPKSPVKETQVTDKSKNLISKKEEPPVNTQKQSNNFLRSALNRISNRASAKSSKSKTRSSSVPLRTIIANELKSTTTTTQFEDFDDLNETLNTTRMTLPSNKTSNLDETLKSSKTFNNSSTGSGLMANMKTLQLMNKMQSEYEEKQKRRKQKREQKQLESSSNFKSPHTERKFLSSIMNTLFSSNNNNNDETTTSSDAQSNFNKNETKRLSLKKLKAKDKAKKSTKDDGDYQSDCESSSHIIMTTSTTSLNASVAVKNNNLDFKKSNQSLNIALNYENNHLVDYNQEIIEEIRVGKIKNEIKDEKSPGTKDNKENIMKELKAQLDEEIKDRRLIELKNNIINGGVTGNHCSSSSSSTSSNHETLQKEQRQPREVIAVNRRSVHNIKSDKELNSRKARSKSVTFLDDMSDEDVLESTDNYNNNNTNNNNNLPVIKTRQINYEDDEQYDNECYKNKSNNLEKNDARFACGALTGVGPIRGIMKKSATDMSINMMNQKQSNYSLKAENIDLYLNGLEEDDDMNNNNNNLPRVQLNYQFQNNDEEHHQVPLNYPQPQMRQKRIQKQVMQSDL